LTRLLELATTPRVTIWPFDTTSYTCKRLSWRGATWRELIRPQQKALCKTLFLYT